MSNYSDNPAMVRVDFFKPSGNWDSTISLDWRGPLKKEDPEATFEETLLEIFRYSLRDQYRGNLGHYEGMTAVCLEPHASNTHPISMVIT